jgi:hypothetical protein
MFCDTCGAQLQEGQNFCANCGKAIRQGMLPVEGRMASHFRLVGICWIVISVIRLLAALALFLVANLVIRAVLRETPVAHFVPALVSMIGVFLLVGAGLGIAAGCGLLQRQSWSRVLTLVLSFLFLLHVPFGTALGIYSIWVLMSTEGEREFARWAAAD